MKVETAKGVQSNRGLLQETRKISNKQSKYTFKGTEKEEAKSKVSRRKEIRKIRVEINAIETKNTMEMINETTS